MCTGVRFSDQNGNMYFGRNLDWAFSYGQYVVITPQKFVHHSPFLGEQSPKQGAIIGMALIEADTPLYFDCANESGLAVAGLNFPGYAQYEKAPVVDKTNVAAYEFPLWVALNFSTVDEAAKALRDVAIVDRPISDKYPSSMLHWLIADGKKSIVVEYTEKGMEIFNNPADVLANQPGYAWHRENLRNYLNLDSAMPESVTWRNNKMTPFGSGSLMRGLPGDYYSPSRFVRIAYLNSHYPIQSTEEKNISRLFHTLTGVAMVEGAAAMADGKFEITTYTGGYSSASKTYYYNTYEDPAIQHVAMSSYDLSGTELIKAN